MLVLKLNSKFHYIKQTWMMEQGLVATTNPKAIHALFENIPPFSNSSISLGFEMASC